MKPVDGEMVERAFFCIRPQFFDKYREILDALKNAGLHIPSYSTVWLTAEDIMVMYGHEKPSPYFDAVTHFMTRDMSVVGIVEGDNIVYRLVAATGESHIPSENNSATIRAKFGSEKPLLHAGVNFYLNPVHRSSTYEEAAREVAHYRNTIEGRPIERIVADMVRQLYIDRNLTCVYQHHIERVVAIADDLATTQNANRLVVIYAALLHDIASLQSGNKEGHGDAGASKASVILHQLGCNSATIERVANCIRSHSSSANSHGISVEAQILRSADGIANLSYAPLLFYFAYGRKSLDFDAGLDTVRRKVERSFAKVAPFAIDQARPLYDRWQTILN